eukprot:scaffold8982_cov125-Isochrysis_galbana.AAC.9
MDSERRRRGIVAPRPEPAAALKRGDTGTDVPHASSAPRLGTMQQMSRLITIISTVPHLNSRSEHPSRRF